MADLIEASDHERRTIVWEKVPVDSMKCCEIAQVLQIHADVDYVT